MTLKVAVKLGVGIVAVIVGVSAWNVVRVSQPVASRLAEDARNANISLWAYHQYGLVPSVLVIDLRSVGGEVAAADVLRALFQSAESLKDTKFERVLLAYRGSAKLMMEGNYFRTIGEDLQTQNPVYTMRTLPQNMLKLDGSSAYATWTGGWLGVLGKQIGDLNTFTQDWYLRDMLQEASR
ncbi:hypothetical protein FXN63_25565 [Pigmentiphaga aceris]|uniref:Uncharacterized protein n=1 Tax=Pigmentiphaga aceris TaxID=1940612 RepID=A0A5C0B3H9_9BURK|nr:hypothetical protein [Pigmentiphaga aceris]QEI08845.1 hypothetical protein FXN63_25565 [Pigmentiphaga aceris]